MKVRPKVTQFAVAMEKKLRKKDFKGGWQDDAPCQLYDKLVDEVKELLKSIENGKSKKIMPECIDVANYAMMIYDNCRIGSDEKKTEDVFVSEDTNGLIIGYFPREDTE